MKLSTLDLHQIQRAQYDEELNASRVTLVGMENLVIEPKIDLGTLEHSLASQKELKVERIEVPVPIHTVETRVEKIEIPVISKEIQVVEVEKIVYQDRVVKVEVPVIIKEIEYREIEKPIVIKTTPVSRKSIDVFQVAQVLVLLGMFIKMLFIK